MQENIIKNPKVMNIVSENKDEKGLHFVPK